MFIESTSTHIHLGSAEDWTLHATSVLSLGVRTQDAPVCSVGALILVLSTLSCNL